MEYPISPIYLEKYLHIGYEKEINVFVACLDGTCIQCGGPGS